MRRRKRRESPPNFYRIRAIIAQTEAEVGYNNEYRVFEAYSPEFAGLFPPWIYGVRFTQDDDDHRGIDLVFETDVGDIGLQVKSSFAGMRKFLQAQMKRKLDVGIVVAVVKVSDEPKRIREIVTPILAVERRRIGTSAPYIRKK